MDHEHRVELESDRGTRLDVADARQEKRGEALAVAEALPDPGAHLFQQLGARRVFEQAHQRLDRRIEANDPGSTWACAAEHRLQTREERELAGTEEGAGTDWRNVRRFMVLHGCSSVCYTDAT